MNYIFLSDLREANDLVNLVFMDMSINAKSGFILRECKS